MKMKKLLLASALATLALSGTALASDDDDRWEAREDYEEARREAREDYEEALREAAEDRDDEWKKRREAEREYAKELREAEREYWKERGEAEREFRKERAEAEREFRKEHREALKEYRDYRRWARGEHIPRGYLDEPYYVRDYRAHDLAPPPNGYRWVRPHPQDDTYYLVQLATGLIARILGH